MKESDRFEANTFAILLERVLNGDSQAEKELIFSQMQILTEATRKMMSASLLRHLDPEDIFVDALPLVFRRIRDFKPVHDPEKSFRGWMLVILRHQVLNAAGRTRKRNGCTSLMNDVNQDMRRQNKTFTPSAIFQRKWSKVQVTKAISSLPGLDKELIELHYFLGMSISDISEYLNDCGNPKSVDAIKQALRRARKKLLLQVGRPSQHGFIR